LSDSQRSWITVVFEATKPSKVVDIVHYVYLNLLQRFYKLKCVLGAATRLNVSNHSRAKNNLLSGSQPAWITVVFEATKPSKVVCIVHYVYLNLLQRFYKLECVLGAATRPMIRFLPKFSSTEDYLHDRMTHSFKPTSKRSCRSGNKNNHPKTIFIILSLRNARSVELTIE